jgi:hypothetical protein
MDRISRTLEQTLSNLLELKLVEYHSYLASASSPSVSDNRVAELSQCLRIYLLIDRITEAEHLFAALVVRPGLDKVRLTFH